ncbi:hypothetical protein FB451DRAFT_1181784 [Mycena latifolia]|nr:hypothetical protein FB451DRAFT_1181784 [Mycena latifolia]
MTSCGKPKELGTELVFSAGPSSSHVTLGLTGAFYSSANLTATLAPYLKTLPTPSWSTLSPGRYINSVSVLAGQPLNTSTAPEATDTFYTKSLMTPEGAPMSAATIKALLVEDGVVRPARAVWREQPAINAVPHSTAFAKCAKLFTMQLYASSSNFAPPYPAAGFTFLDGMVASILSNSPANWSYGAYLNYADDKLTNASTNRIH